MGQRQEYDAALPRIRVSSRDLARWRRQASGLGLSLSEAVRRSLDAYFAEVGRTVPGARGGAEVPPAEVEDERVEAQRSAIPGLRRGSELGALPGRVQREIAATVRANDAMGDEDLVARLVRAYPGEDEAAVRALVVQLREP